MGATQVADTVAKDEVGRASSGDDALASKARALAELLVETRRFWDQRPFRERPAPWERELGEEAAWLRSLTSADIDALERDPWGGPALPPALAALRDRAAAASALPHAPASTAEPCLGGASPKAMRGVKARKERQIRAFQRAVEAPLRAARVAQLLDWCGGKGHLSRSLGGALACPVCVVDIAPELLAAAEARGAAAGVVVRGLAADVSAAGPTAGRPGAGPDLAPEGDGLGQLPLDGRIGLIALHACGLLTDAAVHTARTRGVSWLAVVPCCHHRAAPGGWRPLSRAVAATGVRLSLNALRLAIADEGPAPVAVRARRRKEMTWRVGLDLLLAEAAAGSADAASRGAPAGVIRRRDYDQPFADLCAQVLASRGLAPPPGWDAASHLRRAQDETRVIRGLALVRGLLRRPVEVLCVLDRALYLQEAGWSVGVQTFCPRDVTPRNLMITAAKPPTL